MTQNEIKKEQNDLLDVFCGDMVAYLTTANDEKARNMQTMKRHFHKMMEELLVDMFETRIRNVLISNLRKEVAEKSEEIEEKIYEKATKVFTDALYDFEQKSSYSLRTIESIANHADVTKIKGIISALIGDAEASRNKLEASKQQIEKRVDELLRITPITESIRATFTTLKEQGIELSSAEAVEIVKAMTEYQSKIVEKESYENWRKIRENGLTERQNKGWK